VNVALGDRTSLNQLYEWLREIIGTDLEPHHGPPRQGDVKHSQADVTCAQELLGYETKVPVAEGLARTVEWYREFRAGRA
jgi:nucleoside-diphosphate-sugar epimerase